MKWKHLTIPREGEGGSGAGAGAGAGSAAGGAQPAGAGQPAGGGTPAAGAPATGQQQQQTTSYRPADMPDHYYDANSPNGTIDKLYAAVKGYRSGDAERGAVPENADGYKITWSDKVAPYLGDLSGDQFMPKVHEAALKHRIGDKQLSGFMNDVMQQMIEGDFLEAPVDLAAEKASLVPESAKSLDQAGQDKAVDARVRENIAWIEAMKARGMPEASATYLLTLNDRAPFVLAMEFLRGQIGAGPQPGTGGSTAAGVTRADLQKRQSDPRNDPMDPKYDPSFQAETQRLYQQMFPG